MGKPRRLDSAASAMRALLLPALAAAATYEELWQAMQLANTQNFRDDIGTILATRAGAPAFGLDDEAGFLRMVSGRSDDMRLAWQRDVRTDESDQLDAALSQALRAQVQRIREALAGRLEARQAIVEARKAFALAHGSVFGHGPREYLTAAEWAEYEAAQAAAEYRLRHPDLGPPSSSP